jgi:hypothetical protein
VDPKDGDCLNFLKLLPMACCDNHTVIDGHTSGFDVGARTKNHFKQLDRENVRRETSSILHSLSADTEYDQSVDFSWYVHIAKTGDITKCVIVHLIIICCLQ